LIFKISKASISKDGATTHSKKLSLRLISGTAKQAKGKSVAMISNIRDQYLVDIQKLRKKYEKKLR